MSEFDHNVFSAKLAEQAERYEDMVQAVVLISAQSRELTREERDLFSMAYKNVVGSKRAAWRVLSSIEQEQISRNADQSRISLLTAYRGEVEDELRTVCDDILTQVDKYLIPFAQNTESKIFYYKMKGDYQRYLAEFATGNSRKEAAENSLVAYKAASELAMTELPAIHPIRLGLALNFSVYYYEILNSPDKACRLAKAAFDDAISDPECLNNDGDGFKDSTLILQLLRDNLNLWTNEEDGEDAIDQKETDESNQTSVK